MQAVSLTADCFWNPPIIAAVVIASCGIGCVGLHEERGVVLHFSVGNGFGHGVAEKDLLGHAFKHKLRAADASERRG
jgi:hypothetical protein